jgi:DNA repair exonuclease SbcCD ATPase subunit
MWLVKSAPDLMQRLSRLPAAPNVTLLDRRKPKPHPWSHANTTFAEQIYIRWCCIDLSNAPAKEEIRDFEKQLADAPKKIEKLEAQVRGQEAETNKQAGKAFDAEKALKAAKDEIASLKKTVEKLEAELTKRGNLVTSQARTLDDLRKKLEASKNPPESRNNRKALIAAKVEARKSAKKDPAFEAIEETLDAASAEQIAVPDQEQKCDFSEDEVVATFASGGK